ncbi:hypothetical protein CDD83_6253 [Cordyceps sp. RAO-2017]|nr:hypothetical protein CDD83_6253 [Cordyceps sp. RAO-2017]
MLSACVYALALGALVGGTASDQKVLSPFADEGGSTAATAFAITYGYPVTQFALTFDSVLSSVGANSIINANDTASAGSESVIRPNVDTLYSKFVVDLSHADVILTIPDIGDDRYYVFPFYDFWSNNFANLGSLDKTAPGNYLLRPSPAPSQVGIELSDDAASPYRGYVNYPTAYGAVFARILLRNQTEDLEVVHELQAQIGVVEVPRPGPALAPHLTVDLLGGGALESLAPQFPGSFGRSALQAMFDVVAEVAPFNRPADPREAAAVAQRLAEAGVKDGSYSPPPDVDFTAANKLVSVSIAEVAEHMDSLGNDWENLPDEESGNFGNRYAARCYVGFLGYLQLVQHEAVYPAYTGSGLTGLSLGSDQSYLIKFVSGKPPVDGFWSITAYNNQSYLIDNSLDRYALGDRSNLTYPDGQPVYGDGDRNDPFSLLIQPSDVEPPANWTNNWLPAPAGGGNFTVNLRFYGPEGTLLPGGSYVYPVVTKQKAITA